MFGPGNNVVVVEAVKEEMKGRQEEVRAAAKNTGAGLREWITEEAAWLFTQFTKVALSVAVVRGVHQLFKIGFASEAAYQSSGSLDPWVSGPRSSTWERRLRSSKRRFGSVAGTWAREYSKLTATWQQLGQYRWRYSP